MATTKTYLKTNSAIEAPTRLIGKDNDMVGTYNAANPNAAKAETSTVAKSKKQIDNMTLRDRLWDAFNFSYGQQRRASDESFRNQISQQGRNQLARGMQRSSYGAATEANMRNKQVQAQNDIYGSQLAEYEKALLEVEREEREAEQWQKQFDEQVRQFNILHGEGGGGGGGGGGRRRKATDSGLLNNIAAGLNSGLSSLTSGLSNIGLNQSKLINKDRNRGNGGLA